MYKQITNKTGIKTFKIFSYHSNLYDYDLAKHVIILNDWFDESAETNFNSFVRDRKSTANPNAILINGKGNNQNSNNSVIVPKATFNVKKNKKYRKGFTDYYNLDDFLKDIPRTTKDGKRKNKKAIVENDSSSSESDFD